jgi:hypothetical protein
LAAVQGTHSVAIAGNSPSDLGNVSLDLGNNSETEALGGAGNLAVNVGNSNQLGALGDLNSAFNLGGSGNTVFAQGVLNNATQVGGSNNEVQASGGTGLTSPGLNVAFSTLGNGNSVLAGTSAPGGTGPLRSLVSSGNPV